MVAGGHEQHAAVAEHRQQGKAAVVGSASAIDTGDTCVDETVDKDPRPSTPQHFLRRRRTTSAIHN